MEDKIIDEVTLKEDGGKVNISDDVVATIAGIATGEIEGVYGMSGGVASGIAEKLGAKKSPQKGVKVDVKPEGATIDLYAVVEFGVRIPELAWNIQENVKNSVETMTGITVLRVNVHIDGVHFKEDEKPAKKAKKHENTDPADIAENPEIKEEM
ncbi:MAG: Asp23/Gls24 family envelope stress response protein [Firmicutes bacterium]|nr:Asp23/Gls24 family envelope stress response protein [Bacillota bacterium]